MNSTNSLIKVFIADKYIISRSGIKNAIKSSSVEVVGETDSVVTLIEKIKKCKPDVLITECQLESGIADEFLPLVKAQFPGLKILMLTFHPLKETLIKYIGFLDGFISKVASGEEISAAIRLIADGNYYFYSPEQRIKKK